jgi:o-succinylbenzoate synthase
MVSDRYRFTFTPYAYPFLQPLQTHHGTWAVREGVWVTLTCADGRQGQGEIAPLPWFGSETLAAAIALCQSFGPWITPGQIAQIPNTMPACQFGFGSALAQFDRLELESSQPLVFCGLLPTGAAALEGWRSLWEQGLRVFKWKIAVQDPVQEQAVLSQLLTQLPTTASLRLDANGGLTLATASHWLAFLADWTDRIEYLEQPLPPADLVTHWVLAENSPIPIALDESVANCQQLRAVLAEGWRGWVVLKPSIFGFPQDLMNMLRQSPNPVVLSSVFETAVGRAACLQLATQLINEGLMPLERALGFGVTQWMTSSPRVSINSSI